MKRFMSLDIGDATIGIAVSDPLGITAQGIETIRRSDLSADLSRLGQLMQEYEVEKNSPALKRVQDSLTLLE